MTDRQRILGIDPGSRLTGFGVLDFIADRAHYVASGSVRSVEGDFATRLRLIFRSVGEIAAEYHPDAVVIESIFVHRNAMSALKLGQARSAALCATFGLDIAVYEYAPREIKQAVVGNGAATKTQVQHMVRLLLNLPEMKLQADAADALAVALTHAHMSATAGRTGVAINQLRRRK